LAYHLSKRAESACCMALIILWWRRGRFQRVRAAQGAGAHAAWMESS